MTAKKHDSKTELKAELAKHGVQDQEKVELVESLVAAGMDRGQLLAWLASHGGEILNILKTVVDLFGGPTQLAAMKGARDTKA